MTMKDWIDVLWDKNVFLSEQIIQEKACGVSNVHRNHVQRTYGKPLSNDWLHALKKRHHFKSYELYRLAGEPDIDALEQELPIKSSLIQ